MNKKINFNSNGLIAYYSPFFDEYGNSVEKTKYSHPYSYDGFVVYRGGKNEEVKMSIWSDRLLEQNYNKTRSLMKKHFGNQSDFFSERKPDQIESFLSEFLNKKIKLILLMEYCNKSSGYPVWRFDISYIKTN